MRPYPILLCATLIVLSFLISCKDSDDESSNEFSNWKDRNESYFESVRNTAVGEISKAKALYQDDWAQHCEWRAYQSYSLSQGSTANDLHDSIYVKVLKTGNGSGSPLSTDSVRVFYAGRLMPSENWSEGMMFDHSGQSNIVENIFNHQTGAPSSFLVSGQIRGFATALQYMHIGDTWQVYIPCELGYESSESGSVPAYSTLVFNVELLQYARAGNRLPAWN
jgi:FKBP-type peptidyl-prolyl cis-trans isomerase FklB